MGTWWQGGLMGHGGLGKEEALQSPLVGAGVRGWWAEPRVWPDPGDSGGSLAAGHGLEGGHTCLTGGETKEEVRGTGLGTSGTAKASAAHRPLP